MRRISTTAVVVLVAACLTLREVAATAPELTLLFDQCSCQDELSYAATLGSLTLDVQDLGSFTCGTEPDFGKAALPGVVVNPSAGSEALRSGLTSIPAFAGSGDVSVAVLVRPLGFVGGLAARSASLVDVRASESATTGAFPKLLCRLSTSPFDVDKMTVSVVSELLGSEASFLFDFLPSQREDYIEVICGLDIVGPYACFGPTCLTTNLVGLGFTLGSFSSPQSVVAVGSGFSAKQFTAITEVEIVEFAFYGSPVNSGSATGFPTTVGIPAPKANEQFVSSEDSGTVSLSALGAAANDPFSSEVAKVFQIVSLPPAEVGVLQDNGVEITTVPFNSTNLLANLAFLPASHFYTANTSCSSDSDFVELLQFQVFDSGLDHACVLNPASVSFCSTQVNDDPVVGGNAFVVDSSEKVKLNFEITDVDDITQNGQPTGTGLAGGQIVFSTPAAVTQGTLFTCNPDGSCSSTTIDTTSDTVPIVDEICICYLRPVTLTGKQKRSLILSFTPSNRDQPLTSRCWRIGGSPGIAGTDDVRLSVEDSDGSVVGPVDVEIQIRELIATCLEASDCSLVTNEGSSIFFELNATSVLGKDIIFSITQQPLNGLLLQGGLLVSENTDLANGFLEYRPSAGYFNVNEGLLSVDGTGTSICSGTPPCLDSLTFRARTDDGSSKEDTATFAVVAVNDELPLIAIPSGFDLEKNKARLLTNVNVLPGIDRDMFEQVVNLTFTAGLQYDLDTTRAVSRGTGTVGSNVQVVETIPSCAVATGAFCTGFISLKGFPTHLNDALDGMRIFSNADSLDLAQVTVSVVDGSAVLTRSFTIRYTVGDNTNDIIGLAVGAIGGIAAVCVLGLLFIRFRRSSRARNILQRADMEDKMESMTGARRAKEQPPPPKQKKKPPKAKKEKRMTASPPTSPKSSTASGRKQKPQKRKEPRPPAMPRD